MDQVKIMQLSFLHQILGKLFVELMQERIKPEKLFYKVFSAIKQSECEQCQSLRNIPDWQHDCVLGLIFQYIYI